MSRQKLNERKKRRGYGEIWSKNFDGKHKNNQNRIFLSSKESEKMKT